MRNLKQRLVPIDIAKDLFNLGFLEKCYAYKDCEWDIRFNEEKDSFLECEVRMPTHEQVFEWFRENHGIYHEIQIDQTTYPKFCYQLVRFVGNPRNLSEKEWYWESIPNDDTWGLYREYPDAEIAAIERMINILKQK
jgi:hypothetical protein